MAAMGDGTLARRTSWSPIVPSYSGANPVAVAAERDAAMAAIPPPDDPMAHAQEVAPGLFAPQPATPPSLAGQAQSTSCASQPIGKARSRGCLVLVPEALPLVETNFTLEVGANRLAAVSCHCASRLPGL